MKDIPIKTKSSDIKTRKTEKAKAPELKVMLARSYQMNGRQKSTKQSDSENGSAVAANDAVLTAQGNSEQAAYKVASAARATVANLNNRHKVNKSRRDSELPQSEEPLKPTPVEQGRRKAIDEHKSRKVHKDPLRVSSTNNSPVQAAVQEKALSAADTKIRVGGNNAKNSKTQPRIKTKAAFIAQQRANAQTAKKARAITVKVARPAAKMKLPLSKKFQLATAKIKPAKTIGKMLIGIGGGLLLMLGAVSGVTSSPYGVFYSSQDTTDDTMPISAVQSRIQAQYSARIVEIESANSHDAVIRHGDMPDFAEVVAVFAVNTTTRNDELAADVVTIDEARAALLCETFWDMCSITYNVEIMTQTITTDSGETVEIETHILHIYTTPKRYQDMSAYYGFTPQQTELLNEFINEREMLIELIGRDGWYIGGVANINMSDAELYELAAYYGVVLPTDLSIERKNVLAAAFAGVQINIPYHYDWRSYYRVYSGIEGNDFGSTVQADYKGRDRKGLDCSGYVGWAYYTGGITWSGFSSSEISGAHSFWATPTMRSVSSTAKITVDNLKPADIGFISDSASGTADHTGIYLGTTAAGVRVWLHCAGSSGAVCTGYNFGVYYTVTGMDSTFGERKTGGDISDSDTELLAQLIYYESRGMNSYCMELVAQVAINRMNSTQFKNQNTITEVLQASGQYGYGVQGMTATLIFEGDITQHSEYTAALWQKCLTAAQRVVSGTVRDENGNRYPANVLYQHSFSNPEALGALYKSYTSGGYTMYFNFG